MTIVERLAAVGVLGEALGLLREFGGYDLLDHHQQGEFHHDLFLKATGTLTVLPGEFVVISTNCNGGIKEVLCFAEPVNAMALWHYRCPDNPEFGGQLPTVLASARTANWFDPCDLLLPDARSELRPEFRERQRGGGWCKRSG